MNNGMRMSDACQEVGITRRMFLFIEKNPQAIAEFQYIIDASNREHLGLVLLSKNELLHKFLEDGLCDMTKLGDRSAIFFKLNNLLQQTT